MRLLLDTHIFLRAIAGSRELKIGVRRLIETADEVYVSAASIWEIGIKSRLGKLRANPVSCAAAIVESGFAELPVSALHAAGVAALENHHGDPFDRLLISQALAEPLRLVTADATLVRYSDVVLLV